MDRGPQAKHDSAALISPWGSPLAFVTSKAGGSGQLSPCHKIRDPVCQSQSHTLRARLGQGPRRGWPPHAAPRGQGNSAQQRSDHKCCPRKQAQLELRPPLKAQDSGQAGQPLGLRREPQSCTTEASRSRPHWMRVFMAACSLVPFAVTSWETRAVALGRTLRCSPTEGVGWPRRWHS